MRHPRQPASLRRVPDQSVENPVSAAVASCDSPTGNGVERPRDWLLWHRRVLVVALFLVPLATAPAAIGLAMVAVSSTLHARTLGGWWREAWRTRPLVRWIAGSIAAFAVFAAIAIAWSPDRARGLDTWLAVRWLLLGVAVAPVAAHPRFARELLIGLLGGVFVQNVAQLVFFSGLLETDRHEPWQWSGGLSRHPGPTALWSVLALTLWCSIAHVEWRGSRRTALVVGATAAATLALVGLLLSGNRAVLLALLVVAGLGAVIAIVRSGVRRVPLVVAAVLAVATLTTVVAVGWNSGAMTNVREAAQHARDALVHGDFRGSSGKRLAWWRTAFDAGFGVGDDASGLDMASIVGHGLGSTEVVARESPLLQRIDTERQARASDGAVPVGDFVTDDLHSLPMTTLVELGVVGLALLAVAALALLRLAAVCVRGDVTPWAAAIVVWLLYALFNTAVTSGPVLVFLTVAVGFSLASLQPGQPSLTQAAAPAPTPPSTPPSTHVSLRGRVLRRRPPTRA